MTVSTQNIDPRLSEALEIAWNMVFKIVNSFLTQNERFGIHQIEQKSNPKLEDMLLSLRIMSSILDAVETQIEDTSDIRKMLNAKQHILNFEEAVLAIKERDQGRYDTIIDRLKTQVSF